MLPQTYFLPVVRADLQQVEEQRAILARSAPLESLMRAAGIPVAVLNRERQLVFASPALAELCRVDEPTLSGLRLGEALGCENAQDPPAGCGTTPSCAFCGAAHVMEAALRLDRQSTRECRILRADGEALTFKVAGGTMQVDGTDFLVLSLQDISDKYRRDALERLFFHDVMNAAGALKGLIEALPELSRADVLELSGHARQLANQLVDEIAAQRDLRQAESGTLDAPKAPVDLMKLVEGQVHTYGLHRAAMRRTLKATHDEPVMAYTHAVLLGRVLGNLVLNALEASHEGGVVHIRTGRVAPHRAFVSVHNAIGMPKRVELQVYQRGFTTSGRSGRGLGTYSVKLLTERYLDGNVSFTTSDEDGTTFTVELPALS